MVQFIAMDTETVRHLQAGGGDANGHVPERHVSTGSGECDNPDHEHGEGARFAYKHQDVDFGLVVVYDFEFATEDNHDGI